MRKRFGALTAGGGLLFMTMTVVAHHGFDTEYEATKKVSSSGVVSKVEWTNPHMHIYIDVTDAGGKVTTYNMEMASPNTVQRQGWGMRTVLPGDKVVFEGYAGKVVATRGALAKIAKAETPDQPLFVQGGPESPGFPSR